MMFEFDGGFGLGTSISGGVSGVDPFGGDILADLGTDTTLSVDVGVTIEPGGIIIDLPPIEFPDPAVAVDDTEVVSEDGTVTINVLENDIATDPTLVFLTEVSGAENGTVSIESGTIVYTPNADFFGVETFTYTIIDAATVTSSNGTVTVTIESVNDAPEAVGLDLGSFAEDASPQAFDLLDGVTDIDSAPENFSINSVSVTGISGTPTSVTPLLAINEATGEVTLDPSLVADDLGAGESATFEIAYQVADGDGGSVANTATFTVTGLDSHVIIPGSIVVDTLDDVVDANDGFTSLREAVALSNQLNGDDVIHFCVEGTIELDGDIRIRDDVRMVGNDVVLDAGGRDNIFDVDSRVTVEIENLGFANGDGRDGGAIDGENDVTLTLTDVTFLNNDASNDGGAIAVRDRGDITISGGTFSGNNAGDDGGAISGDNDLTLTITDSVFNENGPADNGGAISARDRADISVTGGSLTNNIASDNGGAIYVNNDSTIDLTDVALDGNSAGRDGGAVWVNDRGVVNVSGGSVSGNTAQRDGGAVLFDNNGTFTIDGTTVQGNSSGRNGGAAAFDDRGSVSISNATIDGNSSGNEGGAFSFDRDGSVTVENSTISNNNSFDDGGVFALDDNGTVSITGSLLLNNSTTRNVGDGAVIYVDNGNATVTIADTSAIGNSAGDDGGVIATEIDQPGAQFNISITGDADDRFEFNTAGDDGGVLQVHNNSTIFIDGITIENNGANDDGGVIAVNDNTLLFVDTPSEIFNSSNSANDGDFLFSRRDISGEVNGIAFDSDFVIF